MNRVTGFASAKVGRMAAFTIGGAIILIEIANEQGIIKIDWNRLIRKTDQVTDKVQEAVTGQGPKWMEKVIITFNNFIEFYSFYMKKKKRKECERAHCPTKITRLLPTITKKNKLRSSIT